MWLVLSCFKDDLFFYTFIPILYISNMYIKKITKKFTITDKNECGAAAQVL